jgi:hypothetical protein
LEDLLDRPVREHQREVDVLSQDVEQAREAITLLSKTRLRVPVRK